MSWPAERELGEAGLGDGLGARRRRPRLSHARRQRRGRTRRWWAPRCRPGPGRRRRRRSPCRRRRRCRRACRRRAARGVISTRLPGATPTCGRRRGAGGAPVALLPDGPTQTSTGTVGALDPVDQLRRGASSATTDPPAVQLEDQGDGAAVLGLGDLRLDEVDQHPIEQPADLDHGHVARVVGLRRGAAPAVGPSTAASDSRGVRPPRPALGSVIDRGPGALLRSISAAHRGREGRRGQNGGQRHPGPRGRRVGPVDPGHRGRGQVGAGHDVRPAAPRLRGGGALRRRGTRPGRARCGPARSRPTTRCSTTSTTTACRGISKRLVSSGALDVVATAAPGIKDILILGKVKQLERAGERRPHRARRPGGRPRHHLPPVGQRSARHGAGGADQRPGPRRAGDAHRPRPLPGRARHAARGDAGQRARRHRLQPRGPGGRRPRAGGGQRPLRRPARAATTDPRTPPRSAGSRPARGRGEALPRPRRVPRRPHGAAGRAGRPPGRAAPARADPPPVRVHRRDRSGRARGARRAAAGRGRRRSRRSCDGRRRSIAARARARSAASWCAAARAASARRPRRRCSPSKRRAPDAGRCVVTIDPAKRLADALGPRGPDRHAEPDRRRLARRAVGAHARHQEHVRRPGGRQRRRPPSRPSASSTTASTGTSPAPCRARRSTWRWRSSTSCTTAPTSTSSSSTPRRRATPSTSSMPRGACPASSTTACSA